jgi:hypothetical protein
MTRLAGIALMTACLPVSVSWASAAGGPTSLVIHAAKGRSLSAGAVRVMTASGHSADRIYGRFRGFDVSDLSGTGAGWEVTIQLMSQPCWTPKRYCAEKGRNHGAESIIMPAPKVICETHIQCARRAAPPAVPVSGVMSILTGPAIEIASAARGTGMGSYHFDFGSLGKSGYNLAVATMHGPGAGRVSAAITISVVSGPA